MEKRLYTPTEYIEGEITKPIIFLAGPIQGTGDWQSKATDILLDTLPNIIVASPRKTYLDGTFNYVDQVDWESFHLKRAGGNGVIMFWLAKETDHDHERSFAQTTRFELAEWKERHINQGAKLVVGIEPGFTGERYIRRRFSLDCPDIPILDNLHETCITAVGIVTPK